MNIKFAVIGEGQPDHIILKNIIHGFFKNKLIPVNRWLPESDESVGWDRVLKYLATEEFRTRLLNTDFCIVQVDTNECEQWNEGISHIGGNASEVQIDKFIEVIKAVLIKKIGADYSSLKNKIIFAITVHDLECWLLPFNSNLPAEQSKIFSCKKTMQGIAKAKKLTIDKKSDPYKRIKSFEEMSKEMRDNKELLEKSKLNPSLKIFVNTLSSTFPFQV
ncbi:MAG: hypothetical protein COX07_06440 [Bacteroidetes bacterium CG23_combo_of_CG06-09_8_20_14_all_32_9]|nr:MAG: hypothetical protein COX07_06440 [Bacteroidetes bacterium CG23_combo_of_CG06-09_8_20_14_all_32_9]